jgi:hypothetical protein
MLSCSASLIAMYLSMRAAAKRWWAAIVSCGVGLTTAYWGLTRMQLHASKTVNDHVVWSFNSRWFFIAALVLAFASLALTLWTRRNAGKSNATAPI